MTSSDADGHTPTATPAQADLFQKCRAYQRWLDDQVSQIGFYPYFAAIQEIQIGRASRRERV